MKRERMILKVAVISAFLRMRLQIPSPWQWLQQLICTHISAWAFLFLVLLILTRLPQVWGMHPRGPNDKNSVVKTNEPYKCKGDGSNQ